MKRVLAVLVALLMVVTPFTKVTRVTKVTTAGPMQLAHVTETAAHVVASSNWSGYALQGRFTQVSGTFVVPGDQGSGMASEWVGVDGYNNTDLIQAGVAEAGGTAWPWWEILPGYSVPIGWMKINPADKVTVGIRRIQGGRWIVDILDHSTLQFFHQTFRYAGPTTSAEWVVEAPESFGQVSNILAYGFAQFSALSYTGEARKFDDVWLVQDGAVQSVPSAVGGIRALIAGGFATEFVG